MKEEKIKVIMLEPGKTAYLKEVDNTLESLQREVEGYIEVIYPFEEEFVLYAMKKEK